MTLDTTDLMYLGLLVVCTIVLVTRDDPRWWHAVKRAWRDSVGAWCARRRSIIRLGKPEEHSAGIMASRRDINTGTWT